jgi:hypothetical protein
MLSLDGVRHGASLRDIAASSGTSVVDVKRQVIQSDALMAEYVSGRMTFFGGKLFDESQMNTLDLHCYHALLNKGRNNA